MTKVLTIQGCADCPYLHEDSVMPEMMCYRSDVNFYNEDTNENEVPENPHPNCRLNDLPTDEQVYDAATDVFTKKERESFTKGANYILNKIKK